MSGAFQLAAFMVFDSFSYMYVEMEFGAKKIKKKKSIIIVALKMYSMKTVLFTNKRFIPLSICSRIYTVTLSHKEMFTIHKNIFLTLNA